MAWGRVMSQVQAQMQVQVQVQVQVPSDTGAASLTALARPPCYMCCRSVRKAVSLLKSFLHVL